MKTLLIFLLLASIAINAKPVLAQSANETITISTYYPAPYGVYGVLRTKRIAIGDPNQDGMETVEDQPSFNGSIAFEPVSGDPSGWPMAKKGELAYSGDNDAFYYFNGANWTDALTQDGGVGGGGQGSATACGNGLCDTGETCVNCYIDCTCPTKSRRKICPMNLVPGNPGIRRSDLDKGCRRYCSGMGLCTADSYTSLYYSSGVTCPNESVSPVDLPTYPVSMSFDSCTATATSATMGTERYCRNDTAATCSCGSCGGMS